MFFTPRSIDTLAVLTDSEVAIIKQKAIHTAVEFAEQWRAKADETEMLELLANRPRSIPRPLDVELLTAVETAVGHRLRGQDQLKRDIRAAWWGVVGGGPQPAASPETGDARAECPPASGITAGRARGR